MMHLLLDMVVAPYLGILASASSVYFICCIGLFLMR